MGIRESSSLITTNTSRLSLIYFIKTSYLKVNT